MKKKKIAAHRGFSLIELMMVISIITLISSIVVASLITSREKARAAEAKLQMREIVRAILEATGETDTTLIAIVQPHALEPSSYGVGPDRCPPGVPVEPDGSSECYHAWKNVALKLGEHLVGLYPSSESLFITMMYDPWGVPYVVNERQGLGGHENTCTDQDELRSAGADRTPGTDDDVIMLIPLSPRCP